MQRHAVVHSCHFGVRFADRYESMHDVHRSQYHTQLLPLFIEYINKREETSTLFRSVGQDL